MGMGLYNIYNISCFKYYIPYIYVQKGPYVDSDIGILLLLVYYNIFILDVCVY